MSQKEEFALCVTINATRREKMVRIFLIGENREKAVISKIEILYVAEMRKFNMWKLDCVEGLKYSLKADR